MQSKMHSFTPEEVAQYIKLTLKQWNLDHLKIVWGDYKSYLGLACVHDDKIKLSLTILKRFSLFEEVLKHEIAHFLQWENNGKKFHRKNNKSQYHGADFKEQCRRMGIPARTRIPV
jgi:predicted SprT family Zn-dependent metalloprotease